MFCGTSSFHRRAAADPSAPKCSRSKSKSKSNSKNKNKNPYSSRGLEKFTSVLSELEARREKIMATTGAQGISMIRFMYSNSQDWIPIIVRLRDNNNNNNSSNNNSNNNNNNNQVVPAAAGSPKKPEEVVSTSAPHPLPPPAAAAQRLPWWKWRPAYCMPFMTVFILLCLVIFGRVFAICCTSIWWYSVPILRGEEEGRTRKRVSRKKEYVKKISDKRLPAPE